MSSSRTTGYNNRRLRNIRRVHVPQASIPWTSQEFLPYLALSRLSYQANFNIGICTYSGRQKLFQIRYFDLWIRTFGPILFIFDVPAIFPGHAMS